MQWAVQDNGKSTDHAALEEALQKDIEAMTKAGGGMDLPEMERRAFESVRAQMAISPLIWVWHRGMTRGVPRGQGEAQPRDHRAVRGASADAGTAADGSASGPRAWQNRESNPKK